MVGSNRMEMSGNFIFLPKVGGGTAKFTEEEEGKVNFDDISSQILEKVIEYFYFKLKYTNRTSEEIPEFEIDPEIALELLMAANFLDT